MTDDELNQLTIRILNQGFQFGVRVGNNINGNTNDIEMPLILQKLSDIASGHSTIQLTGAELSLKFRELADDAEVLIATNVLRDQTLATLLLRHIPGGS